MRLEVEVGAVGDALELAELRAGEAEAVLDVDGALGVVARASPSGARSGAGCRGRCRGRRTSPVRSSIQYSCHSSSLPGLTKNSISICSNSRVRKMKLPGVISLRKLLPIWAMPNGGFLRDGGHDVGEVDEDALRGLGPQVVQARLVLDDAEVGLQQPVELARLGPLRRGCRSWGRRSSARSTSSGSSMPLLAPRTPPARWSARNRLWQDWHSVSGSVNVVDVAGGLPDLRAAG